MGLRTCSLLLSILFSVSLSAQDALFSYQAAGETRISFYQHGLPIHQNGNAILIQLAAARDESPRRLRIRVAYNHALEVKGSEMTSPEVTIRFTGVRSTGTPLYRNFQMEDVLTPDRVTCNLNLIDLPDSNVLRQFRLSDLDVAQLAIGYTSTDVPVVQPGRFSVTLSDISCYYSDAALQRFRERIQTINNYYASSALTDSLLAIAANHNPLSLTDLPRKYILLMEINRIVRLIGNHRFGEQLSLHVNDPAQLAKNLLKLDKFSRSATMTFEQQLADPTPLGQTEALNDLSETYIQHLISYIRKSMLLNSERGRIYREYLDTWFQIPGFEEEQAVFTSLVQKMYPSGDTAASISRISRAVCDASFRSALRLISESNYAAAILLLQYTGSFREHNPFRDELPDPEALLVEAVKGIYASYLGIAESCIEQQKWQMADTYIHRAEEYLAEFQGIIPADTMFQRVSGKLFNRRLEGCDGILAEARYQEAYDCYQYFVESYPATLIVYVEEHLASRKQQAVKGLFLEERSRILDLMRRREPDSALACYDIACRYSEMIRRDPEVRSVRADLDSRMLPVRYRQLADRGTYFYLTYNHEEAFRTFNQLKDVGEILGIPVDTALERMYLESYKHHMLNEISMATGMIWKDEFDKAREYAREVESVMDLYNLETDQDLQVALRNYRQKIDLKVCLNLKEESEMLTIRAWRNIELKQFDLAVKQLGDARQLVRQHPECEINVSAIEDTIRRYLSAAFYQEKQQEAHHQVALGSYPEALQLVSDNERFYRHTNLQQFGIPFTPALDFVYEASRVPMFMEAIRFFLQTNDIEAAWSCLTRLRREDVEAKNVRQYQESIGSAMASRDFAHFPGGDPDEWARSYTGGNRWFLKFAQAYTGRWRQLQTEQSLKTP
ncbi:MAG: hypothetical protein ISS17_07385 [Bacteroidales bacterium]|nr:hypothetical protein [Bacteroidales bacterium]